MNNLTLHLHAIPSSKEEAIAQLKQWWKAAASLPLTQEVLISQ